MSNPFANNSEPGDWPDLSGDEYAEIMDIVEDVPGMPNTDGTDDPIK